MLTVKNMFAGFSGVDVLHDISFEAAPGEIFTIIGPNGCGKTTLLAAIAGLLPYRGKISVFGREVSKMRPRERAARTTLLTQAPEAAFSYTVYETVMMGRFVRQKSLFGAPDRTDRLAVEAALEAVQLSDVRDAQITTLSGGMRQRVFLARAIAQDTEIFLLDEPTTHLDLHTQITTINFLREWAYEKKRIVISVLHDINLGLMMGGTYIAMKMGRMKGMGSGRPCDALLCDVFGVDVAGFMRESLAIWFQSTSPEASLRPGVRHE